MTPMFMMLPRAYEAETCPSANGAEDGFVSAIVYSMVESQPVSTALSPTIWIHGYMAVRCYVLRVLAAITQVDLQTVLTSCHL
jgi:hypothetical protein